MDTSGQAKLAKCYPSALWAKCGVATYSRIKAQRAMNSRVCILTHIQSKLKHGKKTPGAHPRSGNPMPPDIVQSMSKLVTRSDVHCKIRPAGIYGVGTQANVVRVKAEIRRKAGSPETPETDHMPLKCESGYSISMGSAE